jgi:hypothetical protein
MKKIFKFLISVLLFALLSFQVFAGSYYYEDYERFEKVIRINTYANKLSYYEN